MARARRRKTPQNELNGKGNHLEPANGNHIASLPPSTKIDGVQLEQADALHCYSHWQLPTTIVSDGAYGLGLFPGDPYDKTDIVDWYRPHVEAWSTYALPETSLWLWCDELGWATLHPLLEQHGWHYEALHIWDKGVSHIAGNVNSKTIRQFPVVTEVCALYTRVVKLPTIGSQSLSIQDWLRFEWQRTGLPFNKTNEACGVTNAATRKYFTACHLWYFPPADRMEMLVAFANQHGKPTERPYFSIDGEHPVNRKQWEKMRSRWNHQHGVTNVWSEPQVPREERIQVDGKTLHTNQKPLRLIERIVCATSDPGDVIWEPFGGTCPTALVALKTNRQCYSAEINASFYSGAKSRLEQVRQQQLPLFSNP